MLLTVFCIFTCSDGVGRTGVFITVHTQLERLKTEGVVDIFQSLKSARIQRAELVDTLVGSAMIILLSTALLHTHAPNCSYTVEPLNNVTFGTSYSVHYREVSFLRRL